MKTILILLFLYLLIIAKNQLDITFVIETDGNTVMIEGTNITHLFKLPFNLKKEIRF